MLAFIADVHVSNRRDFPTKSSPLPGINKRGYQILMSLAWAVEKARERRAPLFCVGDLLDGHRPEPALLARIQEILRDAAPYLILGNHERGEEPGDHSLLPLAPRAKIVDRPEVIRLGQCDVIAVPFFTGSGDKLAEIVEGLVGGVDRWKRRVLVFHLGVRDDTTADYMKASPDSISVGTLHDIMATHEISACVAGNWHEHKRWPPRIRLGHGPIGGIFQIGCLAPTDFRNPGLLDYGWMGFWDPNQHEEWEAVSVPGPRFVQFERFEDYTKTTLPKQHSYYLEFGEPLSPEQVDVLMTENVSGFRVRLDRQSEESLSTIQASIELANDVEEALGRFIERTDLRGMDKANVIERTRGYLNRGEAVST